VPTSPYGSLLMAVVDGGGVVMMIVVIDCGGSGRVMISIDCGGGIMSFHHRNQ